MQPLFTTTGLVGGLVTLSLCLALNSFSSLAQKSASVTGTVKAKDGRPIAEARVFCRGDREAYTDTEGRFNISPNGNLVFIHAAGYRPVVLHPPKIGESVEIILEDLANTSLPIPVCGDSRDEKAGKPVGFGAFTLLAPHDASVKNGSDVDYGNFTITNPKNKHDLIYGIFGPVATSGFPFDDWILSSEEYTVTSRCHGKVCLADFRGRFKDGKLWRHIGSYGVSVEYKDVSAESAILFDKILDGICYEKTGKGTLMRRGER